MKKQRILAVLIVVSLLCFAVLYSLIGAITGIYRVPSAQIYDVYGGTAYLLRGKAGWRMVYIDRTEPMKPFHAKGPIPADVKFPLEDGIWILKLMENDEMAFYAYTPWNLIEVWELKFGKYRDLMPSE